MRFLSVFAEVLNNVRILCVCWVCEGLGLSSVCTVVWMWAYPSACRDTGKHDRNVWRWDSTGPSRDPPAARGCWRTHPTRTDLNKKTAFILVVCSAVCYHKQEVTVKVRLWWQALLFWVRLTWNCISHPDQTSWWPSPTSWSCRERTGPSREPEEKKQHAD